MTLAHSAKFSKIPAHVVLCMGLSADRSLSGIVVGADGQPRSGANVLVDSDDAPPRHAVTDAWGRFTVTALAADRGS